MTPHGHDGSPGSTGTEPTRSRQPKRLILSFLGEFMGQDWAAPVRTGVFLEVLHGAGVAAPAARATLDRLVTGGVLSRERHGRHLEFSLTPAGRKMLGEATDRVRGPSPFHPNGDGWTLVTFSLPEELRTLRGRLRSTLTWHGFAPLRDGLWLASGRPALATAIEPLRAELPEGAVMAFHAQELDGFPIASSVRDAWDIDGIREAHRSFIETWCDVAVDESSSAVVTRTVLVADWLELLRADPRLPPEFMDAQWPAPDSFALYRRLRAELAPPSEAEFAALTARPATIAR
ncbi:PaaX family transcriptional regulator C-terminal domain-containing protein [Microbacterium sp. TWP3-1-2b2]|uniref:PaaX family transcriptional regulator n=1 Tax=Microbacterium sp. TWP3-1-2b2 TaxID=2804651 RepID=UPI003CE69686